MTLAGKNQRQLSIEVGVAPTTIADMRTGKTEPKYTTVFRIAEALGVDAVWLATGKGAPHMISADVLIDLTEVVVVGAVQAGIFTETLATDGDQRFAVPKLPFPDVFGLEVRGDSMDLIYPPGSYVICAPLMSYTRQVKSGDHVVISRERRGEHEYTLKEITRDLAGRTWLNPKSSNPVHQPIMLAGDEDGAGVVSIHSVVVSEYRIRK